MRIRIATGVAEVENGDTSSAPRARSRRAVDASGELRVRCNAHDGHTFLIDRGMQTKAPPAHAGGFFPVAVPLFENFSSLLRTMASRLYAPGRRERRQAGRARRCRTLLVSNRAVMQLPGMR